MEDKYRTGQECQKTGNWLCLGNNKIEQINKGDAFGYYSEVVGMTDNGIPITKEQKGCDWQWHGTKNTRS